MRRRCRRSCSWAARRSRPRRGVGAALPASMQETTSSTLDGVFTSAQARRGRRGLQPELRVLPRAGPAGRRDGAEHRRQRTSSSSGPRCRWGSCSSASRWTMPEDEPGRLSDEEYTDVVAYLLDRSDYPSGRRRAARGQGGARQDHDRRRRVTSAWTFGGPRECALPHRCR